MQTAPHPQSFAPHPLAQLCGVFVIGILLVEAFQIPFWAYLTLCGLATLAAIATLLSRRHRSATFAVVFAFLLAGSCLATLEQHSVSRNRVKSLLENGAIAVGEPLELTGVMEAAPETGPSEMYLTIRAERIAARGIQQATSGVVSLLAPIHERVTRDEYQKLELRYGARIRVMTTLRRAETFRNPGVSSFTEYLERKGYDATGFVKSPLLIERLDDERVFLPLAWGYDLRQVIERQINTLFSPKTAGVLNASLLGNRYYLSREAAERFREGGTFHVLVISGMHISFIGGVAFLFVRRLTKKRMWQFVFPTAALWFYALAVGAEVSVVRAAVTFTLMAFGPVIARKGASLNSLGAAALALLVWRPKDLFDPSFQLTFLSVLAIVMLAWPLLHCMAKIGSWRPTRESPYPPSSPTWFRGLCELLFWRELLWKSELARMNCSFRLFKTPLASELERKHLQRFLRYAFAAFVVSVSVQLMLLPLLILYFHRVSFASLTLNIGVSALMGALAITAIAGLAIAQASQVLAMPLLRFCDALNLLMVHSVDPFERLGLASLRIPEYSGWAAAIYIFYYVPLIVLAFSLARWNPLGPPAPPARRRRRLFLQSAAMGMVLVLAIVVLHPLSAPWPDGKLKVSFLDVGQGDAALVTMPDGTTLLIDGGGRPNFAASSEDIEEPFEADRRSVGEAVVSEYLWHRGLDRIDYILATHADADHIDGLNDVARNFNVGAALLARTPADDPEFGKFSESLRARSLPLSVIGAGDLLKFGAVAVRVLWPQLVGDNNAASGNDQSIVLELGLGERTILMTGDVEKEGEEAIVAAHQDLRSDVVKVAHHGSRTSSTEPFVLAARPSLAIISVGQQSIFGHPHQEVLERWRLIGAKVMTTGRSGTISVTTDGKDLQVESYVPE